MPNYLKHHASLTDELHALKDRVRNLVEHWPTDGEYKEAALRTMLRRHLPSSLIVCRGFIIAAERCSTQIDLLIVDGNKPTLFRDGDLVFVTPDCVKAVIEVKTALTSSSAINKCAIKLAEIGKLCLDLDGSIPWLGIFSYEGKRKDKTILLDAVEIAYQQTDIMINCFAYGKDHIVRFWNNGETEQGDDPNGDHLCRWRVYRVENLASAYFLGNAIDALTSHINRNNAFAWFPLTDGKLVHLIAERSLD